jgi:hypothetical protein
VDIFRAAFNERLNSAIIQRCPLYIFVPFAFLIGLEKLICCPMISNIKLIWLFKEAHRSSPMGLGYFKQYVN